MADLYNHGGFDDPAKYGVPAGGGNASITPVGNVNSTNVQGAIGELDSAKQRKTYTANSDAAMLTAGGATNPPRLNDLVIRTDLGKTLYLSALPNILANWKELPDGDDLSYRFAPGAFDPAVNIQTCNTNQFLDVALIEIGKKHEIKAATDIEITTNGYFIGSSPMRDSSGTKWSLRAGDAFEFYLAADGNNFDVEVN